MVTSLLLAALSLSPVTWQQIEIDQKLAFNTPIVLSDQIKLPAGTNVKVTDFIPLDEIRVIEIKMNITPCKPSMKNVVSDMVIINELYGVQLEKDCHLEVYLELADLNQPSLFSSLSKTR